MTGVVTGVTDVLGSTTIGGSLVVPGSTTRAGAPMSTSLGGLMLRVMTDIRLGDVRNQFLHYFCLSFWNLSLTIIAYELTIFAKCRMPIIKNLMRKYSTITISNLHIPKHLLSHIHFN